MKKLLRYPDLRNSAKWLWGDGRSTEIQSYEGGLLLRQQPPQVPQWQQGGRILNSSHRAPSIRVELEGNVAASQR